MTSINSLISILILSIPCVYLSAGLLSHRINLAISWRISRRCAVLNLFNSLILVLLVYLQWTPDYSWLRFQATNLLVMLLVSFIGWIILRFSQNYLSGDPGQKTYLLWFNATLASVSVTLLSNHLIGFLLAWICISLCLHQLLIYYPDRPRAVLAAHKKFIFARIAEIFLLAAIALLYHEHGSFYIDHIQHAYLGATDLSWHSQLAALLLAAAALIKCAQLPMHGWLMQVVEAPTPISALLHAGIINLGGFLLLSFAPLIQLAKPAQWLLLIVAGLTVLLATLIMVTRISIKVMLAWSTCAQMGFMLIECALGMYSLALLHLMAHSCYKAYAFLNSGSGVEQHLLKQLAFNQKLHWPDIIFAGLFAIGIVSTATLFHLIHGIDESALSFLLVFALTYFISNRNSERQSIPLSSLTFISLLLIGQLGLLEWLFIQFTGITNPVKSDMAAYLWLIAIFGSLFLGHVVLNQKPNTSWGRTLYIWLFAGLYLDEWTTRTCLKLWPLPQTDFERTPMNVNDTY